MSGSETTRKTRTGYGDIPPALSFEEIVKNRTAPPCSLNDFMDYLLHVEHHPENLQFFLWYWDYLERWSSLPPQQKPLSPPWDTEQTSEPHSRFIRYSHKRERSLKMSKIIAIMEMDSQKATPEPTSQSSFPTTIPSPTPTASPPTATTDTTTATTPKDNLNQPFRDELQSITTHYLNPTSPHRLPLPPSDRESILRTLDKTTHPSSLLPAFLTANATLRLHSYPSFLRFARSNANTPRIHFLRYFGTSLVLLGILVDILLILSRLSAYLRVVCLGFWWPGLTVLVAAGRGVCVGLAWRGVRQVRPWEFPREQGVGGKGDVEIGIEVDVRRSVVEGEGEGGGGEAGKGVTWKEHRRMETRGSVFSIGSSWADSLRKSGLRFFEPGNDHATELRMARYRGKGLMRKVFDETVPVRNKALVMWQDRTVLVALLWGAAGATALTVVSLFLPSGRLF